MRAVWGVIAVLSLGTGAVARAESPGALRTQGVIAVHVAELGELSLTDVRPIVEALQATVERVTGRAVVFDDPTWGCESRARCAADVAARTSATDVLVVDVFEGPTKRHVIVERTAIGGATSRADAYVARTRAPADELEALVVHLFPEPRVVAAGAERPENSERADVAALSARVEAGPRARTIVALVALGVGGVSGGGSALFAVSSARAQSELRARVLAASEYETLTSRAEAHGLAAAVLAGVAIASATTALVLFVTGE